MPTLDSLLVKREAKRINAKQIKGSGNQWYAPGDIVRKGCFFQEHKYTKAKSFKLSRELICKTRSQASELPWSIQIEFLDGEVPVEKVAVMDIHTRDEYMPYYYHCPDCNKKLGLMIIDAAYCPICGSNNLQEYT